MPFGVWTPVGPRKNMLDVVCTLALYLANTIEPSMCGGDAAFFVNYFDHLFIISVVCTICSVYDFSGFSVLL